MTVTNVSHFGICVSDLDKSIQFYCAVLGFKETRRRKVTDEQVRRLLEFDEPLDMELVFVEMGDVRLELIHLKRPKPLPRASDDFNRLGFTHLSVWVDDFDATIAQLERAGVAVRQHTIGSYTEANRRFAFCSDPDGQRVEIFAALS